MNCIIPGANMKVISKALQALSKIGDDIYLKPKKDHLCLESVNMTTTAYCIFHFYESFFSSYEVLKDDSESSIEPLLCKITTKAMLGVFKSHGPKDVPEYCKIEIENSNSTAIIFKLKYKHDVLAIKSLYLNEGQVVSIVCNKDLVINQVAAPTSLYSKVLSNFQLSDDDISFDFTHSKAVMRNYITGNINSIRGIRSQVSLMASEFTCFKIDKETNITFSLKPFRAATHFAECFNLALLINFEATGKPAVLVIKSTTFEANIVLATLKSENDTQTTLSSTVSKFTKLKHKSKNNPLNMTVQDQQVLDSFNWDNDFEEINTDSTKKRAKLNDILAELKDDHRSKTTEGDINENDDIVPNSPMRSQHKRIKSIFSRCFENTFHSTMMNLGEVLALDSDTES